MRKVNKDLLRRLIRLQKGGRTKVAEAAKCSPHTVSNWTRERYTWGVQEYHALEVAKFFKVDVDQLFPPVSTGEERAS